MKNTLRARRLGATSLLALSFVLALAGCGGGGGGTAAAGGGSSGANFLSGASADTNGADARTELNRAENSLANEGSVSQSTNLVNPGTDNLTQDSLDLVVTGADLDALSFALSYDGNSDGTAEDTISSGSLSGSQLQSGDIEGGDTTSGRAYRFADLVGVPFDPDGDGTDNGNVYAHLYTNYDTANDTDYVSAGIWLYAPTNSSSDDYAMGAFVDPAIVFPQANLSSLTGSATYNGEGTAVYSVIDSSGDTEISSVFFRAAMNANFDTDMVSGTLDQVVETDGSGTYTGSLTLGNAPIGSGNGGFFRGALSGNVGGIDYTGNWGGQFFQEGTDTTNPAGVAGTASGAGDDGSGTDYTFVGAFITYD